MRPHIVAPYTSMTVATLKSLKVFAPDAELVWTGADPFAYWNCIKDRWAKGNDLVIIENDIEITAETIPSFISCAQPWCTFKYRPRIPAKPVRECLNLSPDYWTRALGCVRFRADFQERRPMGNDPISYLFIDADLIFGAGDPHVHGVVNHYHVPADGTWAYSEEPLPSKVRDVPAEWAKSKIDLPTWEQPGFDWKNLGVKEKPPSVDEGDSKGS